MEQKRILSWVVVVVMIFTILLPTKKVYALSSYVIGGQTSNGSLKVTIDGTGEIYVEKYNGSDFQQQYYAPSGAVLNVDGQLYTIGGYYTADNGGNINSILAAVKTQTADSNSVTTVWDAGLIEVTQKVTLPSLNSQYIKLDWSFNNISGSLINNIHFLRGEDTYLNGGDNGAGFWDAPTHTIGVTKTDNGVTQRLGMQGITTPNSYTSQEYDIVANEVCGGETLSNTIDDNVNTDNGYALEWNTSSLAANSTWKVSAIESFIASSITASADNGITVGGPVTLTFNVTNSSNNSQDVTYSISNIDGWSVQLQKESDTIASHATNSLSAVVTPSGSINNGVYEIQLNISSGGVETQAIGTVTVNITQAVINSVSVSPETASVVQGQNKQLGSTVNAVGGAAETVMWSSGDASGKVTVDETGLVTVASDAAPGDYTITATSTFDTSKTGTATITVTPAAAINSVSVSPETSSVVQGQTKQLESTVNAVGGAAEAVTWSSSDVSGKVTVDETGLVTVASDAAPGDYTITATSTFDTSKKGTATITVTAAPVVPAVNSVAVDPTTASIVQGENKQLTKTVIAVGGAAETVTWSSSDASGKVTVDETGLVTVASDAAPGDYTITATSTFDTSKKGTATITVTPAAAINSVSVSPETASVVQGQTKQLESTVNAVGGAAETVTWSSSDASGKVTVDETGLVTVASDAAPGDYIITATSTFDTSKKGTATITVTAAPVAPAVNSVAVDLTTASIVQGENKQLTKTVIAVGGAAETVTWSSSDASGKVTVDETGLVIVASDAAPGDYTITATSTFDTSKKGTATITVTAAPVAPAVNSVAVDPTTASIVQGENKQLTKTVIAVGGAAETVTWSSSDASGKVTVDSNGLVTVASDAAPGDYTITATSTFDSSKKGTATITVSAAPVAPAVNSVAVDPTTASIVQGENKQLIKTVIAVGGAAETVTWSSGDASGKVTVDSNGLVTVASDAAPGDYTITATSTFDTSKKGTATITVMTSAAVTYTLNYTAEAGGTIEGDLSQTVDEGSDGTTVTAVPDTGYHFVNWSDGKTNASRMDTNVHDDISVSAEFEIDLPNDTDTTTPAAVRISGNQKVDNTLEALLIDENGLSVTTSSAVTYKWYRISGNDADNGTLVGEGSTYKLISSDIGKYIKLVVSYIDKTFEKITSKISGNSSSGSSGSSGHSSSSTSSSNTSSTEKITVKVTDGKSDTSISKTVIERTTASDGTKKDIVTYTPDKAKETVGALTSEGKDTARIVATDTDNDVSETKVNIPKETLTALSSGNVNLQIETGGAIVSLPKESVQGLAQSGQLNGDLYFRLVPIKDETRQTEIKTTANQQAIIKAVSGNNGVQVLGTPMTIETNMSQRAVDIVLPLKGITLPTDATERQAFLNDLGVFIEHSDGEKVLEKGQVVEYAAGVFGIKFTVNKFSDFTIVKLNKNNQTGWKLDNGYWYFFDNAGTMITGWYKSESGDWVYDGKDTVGQWFHLGRDGRMDTGWFKDSNGTWYYLCDGRSYGALGYMETGWKFIDGKWYFLKSNGAMATGWTYVDGSWYYLYSDGSMAGDTEIDGYRLDTSGAWINN
ncbi:beta strand repeat-containing protein [Clostridium beijerinckii]|uniref:Ig-like domain-containing protein n=3 Tax=Clostridium beijerinckii TaxID=1520 RepID=A0AB74VFD2_CLOBE|nr:Ig-like domain-containing protein [Clostridium beijerinckii]NRZ29305.1 uncharacterized protein YjdB [Clostridium beijerinckii]NYB94925.1 uncharacterized protein YjdB [Clostridium beijerinckii]OOM25709.1 putative endo-beta-N-acetylglucosaminidase precursor [Clostridium beijerinckii]QUN34944.1 Ig-like domain-containing protein [Clostridium beijerinckii]SQB00073.1 S-layer domain-containing protein [Clostridium beijerinckii]